jgi:hypothetical protein
MCMNCFGWNSKEENAAIVMAGNMTQAMQLAGAAVEGKATDEGIKLDLDGGIERNEKRRAEVHERLQKSYDERHEKIFPRS